MRVLCGSYLVPSTAARGIAKSKELKCGEVGCVAAWEGGEATRRRKRYVLGGSTKTADKSNKRNWSCLIKTWNGLSESLFSYRQPVQQQETNPRRSQSASRSG